MSLIESLTFKIADSDERAAALRLRTQTFEDEHSFAPLDRYDLQAVHLVAVKPSVGVISGARLLGPSQRPFDLEKYCNLHEILPSDSVPGMVGAFCVHKNYRRISDSIVVQTGMLKLTYTICRRMNITDVIMYTFSHLIAFYRSASFKLCGHTFVHSGYKATMHLMTMNLDDFERTRLSRKTRFLGMFDQIRLQ